MPLRNLVKTSPETLFDMLNAADDRYREAEALLIEQEFDGCIYLFGYAVEMWLKAACLRLQGHPQSVEVKSSLAPIKRWMLGAAPSVSFTDYHDLGFFGECVFQLRASQGRALTGPVAMDLRMLIIDGFNNDWAVEMRYRRSNLAAADAWSALTRAWWMKSHWIQLT